MANLKDIRIRINSVRSTRQLTSAMKMVSAAKFKKAQDDVEHIRPFVSKLVRLVSFLAGSVEHISDRYQGFIVNPKGKVLIVSIASNRGLAGAFNSNVIKETERLIRHKYQSEMAAGQLDIITIGKQATKTLTSHKYHVLNNYDTLLDNMSFENVDKVAMSLADKFFSGEYREVQLVYNQFVNAAVQNVQTLQMLPLSIESVQTEKGGYLDFIVEPSKEEALEVLIPQTIKIKFYEAMLESVASEHGARMTSMHKATDNATDLLGELQLQYNKARQTSITNELIEIVSGAEALNN